MGTRADFYAGKGKDAEWLGSIAWDGYEVSGYIRAAKTEANFRKAVAAFLSKRDDATLPAQGWPWPWDDSSTTDCSYWFFDGKCWEEDTDHYVPCGIDRPEFDYDSPEERAWFAQFERIEFPDMSARKNVTLGKRSGVLVFGY